MVRRGFCVVFLLAACVSSALAQDDAVKLDVPYVPTPPAVVEEMLRQVNVRSDDIVYDLGCGDGRIVIAAVAKSGARGVGIDIDPARLAECRFNAEKAGVTNRVTFKQQDLFKTDFSEATVLTMYLLSSVNLKLRPTILSDFKPGTRVVSHDFGMGDWKPDRSAEISEDNAKFVHTVYFWVVPANATGAWTLTVGDGSSRREIGLAFDQQFQVLKGTVTSPSGSWRVTESRLNGPEITFTMTEDVSGRKTVYACTGRVEGDRMTGTARADGSLTGTFSFTGRRDPSTKRPLDSPEIMAP